MMRRKAFCCGSPFFSGLPSVGFGWFCIAVLTCLFSLSLFAEQNDPYKFRPPGHDKNKRAVAASYEANRAKYAHDTNILVLPGLVADRQQRRVEVMVESTKLSQGAACEFTVVGENSQHAYESLIISFAKPSDIHQALKFIGAQPGEPADPGALRYWAKGECFRLSVSREHEAPCRLEQLVIDRRTGKSPPEVGFRFTGSVLVPDPKERGKQVYAADQYQPMAIVSLFNSPDSVFEVPYLASKEDVYQNMIVNPDHQLSEDGLLALVIEPLNPGEARRTRNLVLEVHAGATVPGSTPGKGLERVGSLTFQLKDGSAVLNTKPGISSVVQAIGALDRKTTDNYLKVGIGDEVDLASAQALAKLLALLDCERGIRVDAPPAGQLHYRAFIPDRDLLDRETRMYHPWELALSEENGKLSGRLIQVDSVWESGASSSKLQFHESTIANSKELRKALDAEAEQSAKPGKVGRPAVIMVFAPSTLKYGQLIQFLGLALTTHKTIHLYLDEPLPPLKGSSEKK